MVFNATFNNTSFIYLWSVLLVEETVSEEKKPHRPAASHRQPLSHNVVHLALGRIRTHNSSQYNLAIKMRSKNYHTFGTIQKSNRKIIERSQIGNPNTITHDHPLC